MIEEFYSESTKKYTTGNRTDFENVIIKRVSIIDSDTVIISDKFGYRYKRKIDTSVNDFVFKKI